eukprot:10438874-Alexandrium_andersonii.AAC.1
MSIIWPLGFQIPARSIAVAARAPFAHSPGRRPSPLNFEMWRARLTTNSRPYMYHYHRLMTGPECLATHGFPIHTMDLSSLGTLAAYTKLAGNCMSLPVVGACLAACLVSLDWGEGLVVEMIPHRQRTVLFCRFA